MRQMPVQLGPWRVVAATNQHATDAHSEAEFRDLFRRFPNDELNGWSASKQGKMGQLGLVTDIYEDKTVTMVFEDLERLDFPFEALEPLPPEGVTGFLFLAP